MASNLLFQLTSSKRAFYYFINIAGNALAIFFFIISISYYSFEMSFDKHFENNLQKYRIYLEGKLGDSDLKFAAIPPAVGKSIGEVYPEVSSMTRAFKHYEVYLTHAENKFQVEHAAYVDANFLNFFDLELLAGARESSLTDPGFMAISHRLAKRIFGPDYDKSEVLGSSLRGDNGKEYYVSSIYKIPSNTHFQFEFLFPLEASGIDNDSWTNWGHYTYLELSDNGNHKAFEEKVNTEFFYNYFAPELERLTGQDIETILKGENFANFLLQPITDIHLKSYLDGELQLGGDQELLTIVLSIACFILGISLLSFSNFYVLSFSDRVKSLLIKKLFGASKKGLIMSLWKEAMVVASLVGLLALIIFYFGGYGFLSLLNIDVDQSLKVSDLILYAILSTLVIGGVCGLLTSSFVVSGLKDTSVIKVHAQKQGATRLRFFLTVLQCSTTIFFIAGTILIYKRLDQTVSGELGYNTENVLVIEAQNAYFQQMKPFADELLNYPIIESVSQTGHLPISSNITLTNMHWQGSPQDLLTSYKLLVDEDFISTYGVELLEGKNLSGNGNITDGILINEKAAKSLGLGNKVVGSRIAIVSDTTIYTNVVGLVKDFHFKSIHEEIPSIVMINSRNTEFISIRFAENNAQLASNVVNNLWGKYFDSNELKQYYFSEKIDSFYENERNVALIFLALSILSIITSSLSLYALMAFIVREKSKMFSIKKVLGATPVNLLVQESKIQLMMILISSILVLPLFIYFQQYWNANFKVNVEGAPFSFVVAVATVSIIVMTTFIINNLRIIIQNPTKFLRNE